MLPIISHAFLIPIRLISPPSLRRLRLTQATTQMQTVPNNAPTKLSGYDGMERRGYEAPFGQQAQRVLMAKPD